MTDKYNPPDIFKLADKVWSQDPTKKEVDAAQIVTIDYTNWEGKRSTRRIYPHGIRWGSNERHPQPQWLMDAHDFDKDAKRTFSLKGIHSWKEGEE